jgi:flagellar export protein FliJ
MKSFSFKLQTVQNLRDIARDEAEQNLLRAHARAHEAKRELDSLMCLCRSAEERLQMLMQRGALDANEIALHTQHLEALRKRVADGRRHLAQVEAERVERQTALVEAKCASEAIARLRERQFGQYKSEMARIEQNAIDEMAVLSFARRS